MVPGPQTAVFIATRAQYHALERVVNVEKFTPRQCRADDTRDETTVQSTYPCRLNYIPKLSGEGGTSQRGGALRHNIRGGYRAHFTHCYECTPLLVLVCLKLSSYDLERSRRVAQACQ